MRNFKIINLDTVDSTNTYAMNNCVSLSEDVLVIAKEQTAGRGRLGRSYESSRDEGIFATYVVRPDKKTYEVSNITLVVAVAVARVLYKVTGERPQIKWPNDIILNGKKVCGILTEMKSDNDKVILVAIGVGINVNNKAFSSEIKDKATSLYMEYGKFWDKSDIITKVTEEFTSLYEAFLKEKDLSFIKEEYNEGLINKDKEIIVEYSGKKVNAVQLGIDEGGALKVLIEGEVRSITSGEILVRGVQGYV